MLRSTRAHDGETAGTYSTSEARTDCPHCTRFLQRWQEDGDPSQPEVPVNWAYRVIGQRDRARKVLLKTRDELKAEMTAIEEQLGRMGFWICAKKVLRKCVDAGIAIPLYDAQSSSFDQLPFSRRIDIVFGLGRERQRVLSQSPSTLDNPATIKAELDKIHDMIKKVTPSAMRWKLLNDNLIHAKAAVYQTLGLEYKRDGELVHGPKDQDNWDIRFRGKVIHLNDNVLVRSCVRASSSCTDAHREEPGPARVARILAHCDCADCVPDTKTAQSTQPFIDRPRNPPKHLYVVFYARATDPMYSHSHVVKPDLAPMIAADRLLIQLKVGHRSEHDGQKIEIQDVRTHIFLASDARRSSTCAGSNTSTT